MQYLIFTYLIGTLMVLTIIVVLLNKKTMWSGEILDVLIRTTGILWAVTLALWTISETLNSFFNITIYQWIILIISIGLVVFLLIYRFRENRNQKVLLKFSKENRPEFLQNLSSKLLLSNTEVYHKSKIEITRKKCNDYIVCNKNGELYIKLTDRDVILVEASDLLLEEIEILALKQECWNAYVDSVIKTSPYLYLLPFLSFIAFIVSMLIFAHYYEFTSLYVTQLFYFTFFPMMLFGTIFNFSSSTYSFKSKT